LCTGYFVVLVRRRRHDASESFGPMVQIVTIDLAPRGIDLPADRIGVVIAQPWLELTVAEPFVCAAGAVDRQLAMVDRTLDIARQAPHGKAKTHFTILPEFSVPGLAGAARIDAALQADSWPVATVVIAGIGGLTKPQYAQLLAEPHTHVAASNAADQLQADEWANCIVTWVKAANGTVERWVQPKIWPSWPENNGQYQRMFRGKAVFQFRGMHAGDAVPYRFASLVCFDWIADAGAHKVWRWLLDAMQQEAAGGGAMLPLTWLFVIQHNDKPNHETFLRELADFFNPVTCPSVRRQETCVVFANNAGKSIPGRALTHGCTSLVFSPNVTFQRPDSYFTYSNGGPRTRGNNLVHPRREAVFREKGSCVHSFVQVNPNAVVPGAAGHTLPIENPEVYPVNPAETGPRTPGATVAAGVKWLNDSLDELACLSTQFPESAMKAAVAAAHGANENDFRGKPASEAVRVFAQASPSFQIEKAGGARFDKFADDWDTPETHALEHVVQTLDVLRTAFSDTSAAPGMDMHGGATIRSTAVDILAVRGNSHIECVQHANKFMPHARRKVLVVTRDYHNTRLGNRAGSFLRVGQTKITSPIRFNDPGSNRIHLGSHELLDCYLKTSTPAELEASVYACIN